ncbi:MAG: YfhO family protein [Candidatus Eisenbacteria bacterium]|nr:YfhO family protein [Candidatus Eisenbacteria bacterium]
MAKKKLKEKKHQEHGIKARKPDMFEKHLVLFSLLALFILFLVFFYQFIFFNKIWTSPDAQAPAGFSALGEESIKKDHTYPFWNPYVFCGMPSYGSLTYNPYVYFPNLILDAVAFLIPLPEMTWLLMYYLLGGIFLFLFLRDRNVHPLASLYGASVFLFTPNLIAVGAFGHGSQLITASFIPLLLFLAARLIKTRKILYLALLGMVSGFQLLRGHVQIVYYTWLMIGLYAVVELIAELRTSNPKGRALVGFSMVFLALLLGMALSAFLYLPVNDYSKYSIRGGAEGGGVGLKYATSWSFSPLEMLTFIVPSFMGFGGQTYWGTMPFTDYPNYMGLLPLLLAAAALIFIRTRWTVFFLLLSFFSLLVSFGKHFESLYSLLYDHLPYFNKFRVPVMILVLVQFSVACLSGMGLNLIISRQKEQNGIRKLALYGAIALIAVAFIFGVAKSSFLVSYDNLARSVRSDFPQQLVDSAFDMASSDLIKVSVIAAFGLAGIFFFFKRWIGQRTLVLFLLIVLAIDLWSIDYRIMQQRVGDVKSIDPKIGRDDVVEFLEKDKTIYRILPLSQTEFQTNRYTAFKIQSVGGYHAAKPKLYQDFLEKVGLNDLRTLSMMNVKYFVADEPLGGQVPGLSLVFDGSKKVYLNEACLPRAYFVENAVYVPNELEVWDRVKRADFNPWREAIVAGTSDFRVDATGTALFTKYGFNELRIDLDTSGNSFLVLSDLFYPDWKAYLDNREVPVYRTNGMFRGIQVGPGKHALVMRYESPSLRLGIFASLASGAVIIILLAFSLVLQLMKARREKQA